MREHFEQIQFITLALCGSWSLAPAFAGIAARHPGMMKPYDALQDQHLAREPHPNSTFECKVEDVVFLFLERSCTNFSAAFFHSVARRDSYS
jgi:hypothetical protein